MCANRACYGKTIFMRQIYVEDDHVVLDGGRTCFTFRAIRRNVNDVAGLGTSAPDDRGERGIVFNNQNFHRVAFT